MRRRIPSTRALLAFEAAASHENFSKAAEDLCVTQSAICRQIAYLESFVGLKLFRRSKRGVTLTEAGKTYARKISSQLDAVERDTTHLMSETGFGGSIELAVSPTLASRWLIPRLADFRQVQPEITVHLTTCPRPFLFDETEFDAAILASGATWPGAESVYLMSEAVTPVCSPRLIAPNSRIVPEAICKFPLLQQTTRPYAWRLWFESIGINFQSDMVGPRYDLFSMLSQAAMLDMGIALIPPQLIEHELSQGLLITPTPECTFSDRAYYLTYPEARSNSENLRVFRQWLTEQTSGRLS